jgi:hypothetical protein
MGTREADGGDASHLETTEHRSTALSDSLVLTNNRGLVLVSVFELVHHRSK